MATPSKADFIELVGSGGTLLLGSEALWCSDWTDLLRAGPSVGANTRVGGTNGRNPRGRPRDELGVELRDVWIDGTFTEDNLASASPRVNALTLMRKVANFFDDSCTDRKFTVKLTEDSGDVWEGDGQFEDIDRWDWRSNILVRTHLLIVVSDGRLVQVA